MIADKLSKGIAHLFRKYEVKHEIGTGQLLGPHRVKITAAQGASRSDGRARHHRHRRQGDAAAGRRI